ncbi:DnaB-like helicase C-terminal domain-containing protein [Spirosoma endophyticum]|uniref:Replicative DNA helicase n=1 Tax=Spirosoma endophyticum TaxID=662367 RepID=A0A1I2G2P7_9BACT|nr:DnaB-like helicase C-terminal domain-containing protein [Spirosoma endophyticum]SFF11438.1 replicative DNA helicase [Spirosoma endophyticum]
MSSKKKLQVFVSSTYLDLIKERQAAVEAILTAGHIPAGMELFSAGDKSQMDVIKRWIDESDVYLLLLAGRYGSIDLESGKSYTQLEYEYALEKGKPFFALVITEKHLDEKVKTEGKDVLEPDYPQKLREFKALVKNKLVKFWDDARDIKLAILQTLPEFERRPELIGWVQGNEVTNSNIIVQEIARLTEENSTLKSKELFSVSVTEAIRKLEEKKNHEGLTGVPSGFVNLDRLTSGWQPAELIILAARPAMGKTAFIVSALRNATVDFSIPTAVFSLEMSSTQLLNRLISAEAEIDSEKIRKGSLKPHEWVQLQHKIQRLTNAPIFIDDTPALSIVDLRAKCGQLKSQNNIQLVIIDYLQLMSGDVSSGREQEIASISRALKTLARELDIPVIALSQLSRSVETRGGDKRPKLSDLRESGSIEENADMVLFLYRPEYYSFTEDENGNSTMGIGEVIVAKNRNGPLSTIQLRFINRYTKFINLDDHFGDEDGDLTSLTSSPLNPSGTPPSTNKIKMPSRFDGNEETPF